VRERHLQALRDGPDYRRGDFDANPAARARLYLAGMKNKG
jgi:hypothetical protein